MGVPVLINGTWYKLETNNSSQMTTNRDVGNSLRSSVVPSHPMLKRRFLDADEGPNLEGLLVKKKPRRETGLRFGGILHMIGSRHSHGHSIRGPPRA
jgi:hypothetical protein